MDASSSHDGGGLQEGHNSATKDGDSDTALFCPGFKDVDAFVKHGLGTVVGATKASAGLPQAGDEYDFYRSFPGFREFCSEQGDRLLHCMSQLMQHHHCRPHLRDGNKLTGLEERFDRLVDCNDAILERVGILLDEASGVTRSQPVMPAGYQPPKIVVSSWNRKGADRSAETFRLLQAKNVQRPQLKFKEKVDNSNTPFISRIFIKPNALKPLASYFSKKRLRQEGSKDSDVPVALTDFIHQLRNQENNEDMFSHPYQYELDHLVMPESFQSKPEPQLYKELAETRCQLINNLEDLAALNEKLNKTTEFAVDLEHHSYRSFLGITCLMQISTREEDFIIDTLELRSEMYVLNESFTNPSIVKVFHGADSDIEWLQKDFGLYVVNMFDTHQAARSLNLGRNSLDHLLKVFCNVDSNKRYQLADWRIRPLPQEMIQYAQADTHYLLYMYDRLRADLFDAANGQPSLVQLVWSKSKDLCLKKYLKPIFTEDSYMELYKRQKKSFNSQQSTAFQLMYAWRDKLARASDESTGFVLPNHMMIKIAEELPKEPQGIIACCNPTPPLVRQQVNELHQLIKQSREIPLLKAELTAEKKKSLTPKRKSESMLFGPHDISHVSETDLMELSSHETPTKRGVLFSEEDDANLDEDPKSLNDLVACAKVSIFGEEKEVCNPAPLSVAQQKARHIMESFENPFRMYLPSKDIHINKNAKFDPSTKIYEISKRWKLQSVEQQQKEVQAKQQAKEQAKKAREKQKKAKQSYQESLQNVPTVRQQVLEAKQGGQKRERVTSEEAEETCKPKKKAVKTRQSAAASPAAPKASQPPEPEESQQPPTAAFTAYDYSQSDFKLFAGKPKDSTQFDPNRQAHEPKRKKNLKGNKPSAAGGRSMSYVPAKSDRGFRHNWPKR